MTGQVDIERLLDGWLADGPAVMPDGFLASVAEGIARRPQRVTWRLRGAAIPARSLAAFASGAVAIALVAVLGFNLATPPPAASPTPTGPGPSPTLNTAPTPSSSPSPMPSSRPPSPSPSSEPTDEPGPTPSPVAAGTYAMPVGPLFLTFTVPDGWAFDNRGGSETGISYASDPWQKYIDFMYDIYPLRGTWPACGAQTDWESPHTARDFVDYLEARPDWSGTATRTRIGGLTGWRLDGEFQASPCTIDYTVRWSDNIPTSVGVGPGPWDVYVLDDGSGSALLLEVKGDTEFIDSAQSVIDTFEFSNQPPPSATPTPFAAGPYTTLAWQPQVTLTVPEGWVVKPSLAAAPKVSKPLLNAAVRPAAVAVSV